MFSRCELRAHSLCCHQVFCFCQVWEVTRRLGQTHSRLLQTSLIFESIKVCLLISQRAGFFFSSFNIQTHAVWCLKVRECKDTHRAKSVGLSVKPHQYCMVERNNIYCKAASWVLLTMLGGYSRSRREELASFLFLPTVKILLHPCVFTRTFYHILTHHSASAAYVLLCIMEFSWLNKSFHV